MSNTSDINRRKFMEMGIYAIGGSVSPAYMEIKGEGTIQERKHSNLIFTAVQDASVALSAISSSD